MEAADRIALEAGCARPETFVCDVTDQTAVDGLRDAALAAFGRVDVLINNAGLGGEVPVVDMSDEQWSRVLDVTLTSLFRMTRAVHPARDVCGEGRRHGQQCLGAGLARAEGQAHYAAAKASVMAFTRCAALSAADHGVRINAVSPSLRCIPSSPK